MITMENVFKDNNQEQNKVLREKSKEVNVPISKEDENLLREMIEYIYDSINPDNENNPLYHPAVGIAAPQVGVLKKIIAIVAPDEKGEEHELFLINPKIRSYSDELTYLPGGEGCLSVPREVKGLIHRPKRVSFEGYIYNYDKEEFTFKTVKLKGYLAVVFQHEYDHLNGVLFYDHINKTNPMDIPENSAPINFGEK